MSKKNATRSPFVDHVVRELLVHFAGCVDCVENHGSYPESVSCYCSCHDGAEDRWPALKPFAKLLLPRRK